MNFKTITKEGLSRFLLGFALQTLFWFAYAIAWNLIHTLLVKRLGMGILPYSYILCNCAMILNSAIFIRYVDKIPKKSLLDWLSCIQVALLIASRIFIARSQAAGSSFDMELIIGIVLIIIAQSVLFTFLTAVWAVTNDLFKPSEARRVYPLLSLGSFFGGILAGGTISVFVNYFGVPNLILLWILAMAGVITISIAGGRYFKEVEIKYGFKKDLKQSFGQIIEYISTSNTIKAIIIIIFLARLTYIVEDFQFTQAMNLSFHDEASLSVFFGYYGILTSLTSLFVQIFVSRKLLLAIGVFRGFFYLPIIIGLCFLWLLLDFGFWAGFFLNYSWTLVSLALQSNAYQLSYNVVPARVRGKIRGLIDGFASSIGAMLGGVILLVLNLFTGELGSLQYTLVSVLGIILCSLWLLTVAFGRQYYIKDLVRNLYAENRATVMDSLEFMEERREPAANQGLLDILHSTEARFDHGIKAKVMEVLARLGNYLSLRSLVLFLEESEAYLRKNAVMAISAFRQLKRHSFAYHYLTNQMQYLFRHDPSGPVRLEAGKFLIRHMSARELPDYIHGLLHDPDKYARISIIESIGKLDIPFSDMMQLELLNDPNPDIRGQVIQHLSIYPEYRKDVETALMKMLESASFEENRQGLIILSKIEGRKNGFTPLVKRLLSSPDNGVKSLAALAYLTNVEMNEAETNGVYDQVLEALADPAYEGQEREEFLKSLLQIKDEIIDEVLGRVQQLPEKKRMLAQRGLDRIAALLYQRIEEEYSTQP